MDKATRQIAIIVLAALAALTAACNRGAAVGSSSGDTAVAATVNGKNIALKEIDTIINQQLGGQRAQMSPLELATARLQALGGLIQQEVLFQRAEKEKMLPSEDEVTQAINAQKQQNNLTEEEYQKMLQESGQTEQSLRETARKQLAINKLIEKTVGKVSISDREVENFYNNNKERFVSPRGVALAAIIVDPADSRGQYQDDAKSDPEATIKVNNISQQLKSNADFATVARQRSEDATGVRGGDLGFFTEEQLKQQRMPQELIASFFGAMQPGNITPPVRLEDGRWFIFKLTDKRLQSENLTLNSPGVRDQIKQALTNEKQRVLSEALRQVAMNEAKITNNLATDMLNSPNNLSGLRPADATAAQSPGAVPTPTPATPGAAGSPGTAASPGGRQ